MAETGNGVVFLPTLVINAGDRPTGFITLPRLSVTGAGAQSGNRGSVDLPSMSVVSYALQPILGRGTLRLTQISVLARDMVRGAGFLVLPSIILNDIPVGNGTIVLPAPELIGFGRSVPITKMFRGIAMNLSNEAISTYENFNLNSITEFGDKVIGADDTGIYEVGGETDKTIRILSKIKTGTLDLGSDFIKTLRHLWITYRSPGYLAIRIFTDEDQDGVTDQIRTAFPGATLHEERVKFGRGTKGRMYTLEIENLSGVPFDLSSISFMADLVRRRNR